MQLLDVQDSLLEIALELQRLGQRLHRIEASLPVRPHEDEMHERRIPRDLATEMLSTITFGVKEYLRPLIEGLLAATKVTDEELARRFTDAEKPGPQER